MWHWRLEELCWKCSFVITGINSILKYIQTITVFTVFLIKMPCLGEQNWSMKLHTGAASEVKHSTADKVQTVSALPSFAADLSKHSWWLPHNLHDIKIKTRWPDRTAKADPDIQRNWMCFLRRIKANGRMLSDLSSNTGHDFLCLPCTRPVCLLPSNGVPLKLSAMLFIWRSMQCWNFIWSMWKDFNLVCYNCFPSFQILVKMLI